MEHYLIRQAKDRAEREATAIHNFYERRREDLMREMDMFGMFGHALSEMERGLEIEARRERAAKARTHTTPDGRVVRLVHPGQSRPEHGEYFLMAPQFLNPSEHDPDCTLPEKWMRFCDCNPDHPVRKPMERP
jgi:hypothetical protein